MLSTLPYLFAVEKNFNIEGVVILNHAQLPTARADQKKWVKQEDGSYRLEAEATFPNVCGIAKPNGQQWEGSVYYELDPLRVVHEARPAHIRTIKSKVERMVLDIVTLSIIGYSAFTPMDGLAFYMALGFYRRGERGIRLNGGGVAVNTLAQRLTDFGICYIYQSDDENFYLAFAPNMSQNDLLMVFLLNHEPEQYPMEIVRYGSSL